MKGRERKMREWESGEEMFMRFRTKEFWITMLKEVSHKNGSYMLSGYLYKYLCLCGTHDDRKSWYKIEPMSTVNLDIRCKWNWVDTTGNIRRCRKTYRSSSSTIQMERRKIELSKWKEVFLISKERL